jgi:hypothetical protein
VSHLDEPAEIIDLGHDVEPGETEWVSHTPPGTVETACNPFSQHGSGEAPPTTPVEILDPDGLPPRRRARMWILRRVLGHDR